MTSINIHEQLSEIFLSVRVDGMCRGFYSMMTLVDCGLGEAHVFPVNRSTEIGFKESHMKTASDNENLYPPKGTLASYTDDVGYTMKIEAVPFEKMNRSTKWPVYGMVLLSDPLGNTVFLREWNAERIDGSLTDDNWAAMSWQAKASNYISFDARCQALRLQFIAAVGWDVAKGFDATIEQTMPIASDTDDRILRVIVNLAMSRGFTVEQITRAAESIYRMKLDCYGRSVIPS